ncbi:hypothetical protein BTI02_05820 [Lactobacillus delbrueckii subsp. bulgaricus]|nr:hypothetical protein [Lactobacillus delbrueckii subsp. bulgaricus]MBT8827300.1 hypothetical protein [Lactobacillus delbrueckii subsp. bulgaricus]MBT8901681.1 hypothetical protein [Lactobacillus delbrueckii subsp. bulgaricus]
MIIIFPPCSSFFYHHDSAFRSKKKTKMKKLPYRSLIGDGYLTGNILVEKGPDVLQVHPLA